MLPSRMFLFFSYQCQFKNTSKWGIYRGPYCVNLKSAFGSELDRWKDSSLWESVCHLPFAVPTLYCYLWSLYNGYIIIITRRVRDHRHRKLNGNALVNLHLHNLVLHWRSLKLAQVLQVGVALSYIIIFLYE